MKVGNKATVYVLVQPDESFGKDGYRELVDEDVPDAPVFQDEKLASLKGLIPDVVRQHGTPVYIMERTQEIIEVVYTCQKCGADLTKARSISRLYVAKDEDGEDAHCLGHLDESGDFEPDSELSYPLDRHDLLDNSDECQSCGATV